MGVLLGKNSGKFPDDVNTTAKTMNSIRKMNGDDKDESIVLLFKLL